MKKNIIILLIVLVGMVAFTPNANAKTNATAKFHSYPGTGRISRETGIIFDAEGTKNDKGKGNYLVWNEYMKMNDAEYKAWCVDPGLHSNGSYTCSPLTDNGLVYLFDNLSGDEVVNSLAFRFYAIYAGIGNTAIDENGNEVEHNSLTATKAALIRYLQVRDGNQEVIRDYGPDYRQFLHGNEGQIEAAYQLANAASLYRQAQEIAQATEGDGSGLKFTMSSYDATSVTYVVTSSFAMKQTGEDAIKFTCENCAGVDVLSWSNYSVTLKVNQLPGEEGCKFTINATFYTSGKFGCYSPGEQFLVIMVTNPDEAQFQYEGHNPKCGDECCTEEPPEIEGVIANCCEESTHSYIAEPDLDELFCYHDGLKVDKYWEKCGADAYKNIDVEINEYCDMYCTERVTIDVPGAISAKSGRYFTLAKNPVGNTTSPYIQGFKRCRIRIKYDKWEKDYVNTVKKEIEEYNKYQKAKAFEETYKDLLDAGYNTTFTATINCTASVSVDECNCSTNTLTGQESCTSGCSDSNSTSLSCTIPYSHHNLNTGFFNDYFGVKLKNEAREVDDHKSVLIKYDPSGSVTGRSDYATDMGGISGYAADQHTVDLSDCNSKLSAKESEVGASCSSGCGSEEEKWSCTLDYSELQAHIADVTGIHNKYLSQANTANGNYMSHAADAKTLEEKIFKCNDYFNEVSAEEMYEFNPSMSFRYSQIYRDDAGKSVLSEIGIPFKETPGCVVTGPETGGINYEGGMDTAAPRYSEIYKVGQLITQDFASTGLSLTTSSEGFRTFLDVQYDAPKIFTHDARYKAICEWEEDPNNVNTLVPTGVVIDSAVANFTKHEYEYKVFLTTYDGTFETDWSVSNVGEKGKFDDFILDNGGNTCAGNTVTKNEMFSCTLHVEYEIVYVGKCNGTTKNPDDCDPVRNVEGLFQFKVADPANIFPTGTTTDTGAVFAKNWTNTSEGQAVKAEIEQTGKRGLTYSPERESYKFHLTPEIMRHIKNYNVTKNSGAIGGYSDFNMTCECPDYVQTNTLQNGGVGCTKCRSNLLSDLANNTISYEGQSYTVRAWASDKSIDQVRNESHWR